MGIKVVELINDFVSEAVQITTDLPTTVMIEGGEMAEVPLLIEGILVDYDSEWLLLGSEGPEAPELVSRKHVVAVKLIDRVAIVMEDPAKPSLDDMN